MNGKSCSTNNAVESATQIYTINSTTPSTTTTATTTASTSTPTIKTAAFTDIETTQIRKIIASRLLESKQSIPHSYYTIQVRIDKLLTIKSKLAEKGVKSSVND